MSRERFLVTFDVELPPKPSKSARKKGETINQLFDAVIARKTELGEERFKERAIFEAALGETDQAHRILGNFLRDIATCPKLVIQWCQQFLAPRADP